LTSSVPDLVEARMRSPQTTRSRYTPQRDLRSLRTACRVLGTRRVTARLFAVIAAMLLAPAVPLALASVTGSGGTIGKFTFSGALTGKLAIARTWTVPPGPIVVAGCQITTTPTDAALNFFNAKLKLKGRLVTVNGGSSGIAATLDIQVSKRGNTESLSGLNAAALVTFSAFIKGKAYEWQSNTTPTAKLKGGGTLRTNARNTAGSVDATLIPDTPAAGNVALKVKGSWSGCKPFQG
jgi:hypothetical protein